MTLEQGMIFAILLLTIIFFIWGRWRHDIVAMASLLACVLLGLLSPEVAFSGFGHPAVITVACVLVLSKGLQITGAVDALMDKVMPSHDSPTVMILVLMGSGAFLSAFMNNVGAMALLMPVAIQVASKLSMPPGRLLMPLAFGTILGGMTTLVGTPPNIIVAGFRAETGLGGFSMFDYSPVGLSVALVGIVFVALVGWRLVPSRRQTADSSFDTGAYITEVRIDEGSRSIGKSLADIDKEMDETDGQVVGMVRNAFRVFAPSQRRILQAGDVLVIEAEPDSLSHILTSLEFKLLEDVPTPVVDTEDETATEDETSEPQKSDISFEGKNSANQSFAGKNSHTQLTANKVSLGDDNSPPTEAESVAVDMVEKRKSEDADSDENKDVEHSDVVLQELVVLPRATIQGQTARGLQIRVRYGVNLLAISHQGKRSVKRLRLTRIEAGDVLLVQGSQEAINNFASSLGCIPLATRQIRIPETKQAAQALVIMGLSVAAAATGFLPTTVAFALGMLIFLGLNIVPPKNAYDAIDWPVIVLLAALIPVASVTASTGAADLLAKALLDNVAQGNPIYALALILVVTMSLSDFMNNAATAAVMCPIALSTATQLGVNPDPFLMSVAIGASCAFLTPIGHQSNTLILGPGGFGFGDYWKMGLPLEIIVIAVSLPTLLLFWPL